MIAVVVRSASRTNLRDIKIYRPKQAGDVSLVIMVMIGASDAEILTAVRSLLSDDELVAVREAL